MSSVVDQGAGTGRVERYVAQFEALKDRRPAGPAYLEAARARAIEGFAALGFPTTADEEYRYTNVAPIASTPFERAPEPVVVAGADVTEHLYGSSTAAELVFVNGRFQLALSSVAAVPDGLTVGRLADMGADPDVQASLTSIAATDGSAFTALNTAFFEDVAVIRLADRAVIEAPINLVFVSTGGGGTPAVSYPRILILAGRASQCRIIESHVGVGDGTYFSCAVTEARLAADAVVDHYRVQLERSHGYHYCRLQVHAERQAAFVSDAFSLGGAIIRNDLGAVLAGEGVHVTLNGLYVADGDTLVDNHTTIDHAMPHCDSYEIYKGILGGRARGVFNGKIIVREDAQKTDAKQTNKAMLLSDGAQINTKPQLEIFADDVKCTHGATVGQLDADALFYLQARGITRADARAMLIRSFAGEIVARVKFAPLRDRLERWLLAAIPDDGVR